MTADHGDENQQLSLSLDAETLAQLRAVASERGMQPAELVVRWVRERLAHERERALGRARPQRPSE
ncbi:MAG TPA: hypothetical protein VFA70_11735 [Dehalococcoidia bacterium]|nr:hypothetical protein [Dehalococcoidia bacterium]